MLTVTDKEWQDKFVIIYKFYNLFLKIEHIKSDK